MVCETPEMLLEGGWLAVFIAKLARVAAGEAKPEAVEDGRHEAADGAWNDEKQWPWA